VSKGELIVFVSSMLERVSSSKTHRHRDRIAVQRRARGWINRL